MSELPKEFPGDPCRIEGPSVRPGESACVTDGDKETARAKQLMKDKGVLPGAARRRAREELNPHLLADKDRWTAHEGKLVQFTFHRQLLIGRVRRFDRDKLEVIIDYTIFGTSLKGEFRCHLKQLGKVGFLEGDFDEKKDRLPGESD